MESSVAGTPPAPCGGGGGDVQRTMGVAKRPSDFSIEHILRNAGRKTSGSGPEGNPTPGDARSAPQRPETEARFEWLQCTRYHPPKLPRSRRKEAPRDHHQPGSSSQRGEGVGRRKLGRNPRIPFSSGQVSALEARFRHGHYLSSADVVSLARALDLSEARVKIWFQNRRARERRDRESARALGAEGPVDAVHRLAGPDLAPISDAPGYEGLDAPGPVVAEPPEQRKRAPDGGLFPTTPLLQGLHSAFVPFPRSRQPPTATTSQGVGQLSMTSFGGPPSITLTEGCRPGHTAAPV